MNYVNLKIELQKKLHNEILPTKTLNFIVEDLNKNRLSLSAPLDLNINDKGTAFGGSIASLCTITGWSMCFVISKLLDIKCDMVVYESNMNYYRPITRDFIANVKFPSEEQIQTIKTKIAEKSKASLELEVNIIEDNQKCVKYIGKYAFILK